VLAEGIEVTGASLDNGLLHIDLRRPRPAQKVQTIEIRRAGVEPDKTIDIAARIVRR
jgi:hypothetical protein